MKENNIFKKGVKWCIAINTFYSYKNKRGEIIKRDGVCWRKDEVLSFLTFELCSGIKEISFELLILMVVACNGLTFPVDKMEQKKKLAELNVKF